MGYYKLKEQIGQLGMQFPPDSFLTKAGFQLILSLPLDTKKICKTSWLFDFTSSPFFPKNQQLLLRRMKRFPKNIITEKQFQQLYS
jgi:hypothetical protein